MKKIILLAAISCLTAVAFGQGNLQFNATKLIIIARQPFQVTSDTTITIPPGKTWKIERTSQGEYFGSTIKMNGVTIAHTAASGSISILSSSINGPLWIPQGTYTFSFYSAAYGNAIDNCMISALEFNIIP
jgi:hypothetical protein